jgi:hypothetical protein
MHTNAPRRERANDSPRDGLGKRGVEALAVEDAELRGRRAIARENRRKRAHCVRRDPAEMVAIRSRKARRCPVEKPGTELGVRAFVADDLAEHSLHKGRSRGGARRLEDRDRQRFAHARRPHEQLRSAQERFTRRGRAHEPRPIHLERDGSAEGRRHARRQLRVQHLVAHEIACGADQIDRRARSEQVRGDLRERSRARDLAEGALGPDEARAGSLGLGDVAERLRPRQRLERATPRLHAPRPGATDELELEEAQRRSLRTISHSSLGCVFIGPFRTMLPTSG